MRLLRSGLCILVLSSVAPFATAQFSRTWSAYRDMARYGNEQGSTVAPAPGGAYYTASLDQSDALIRKIDASGAVLWTRPIAGPGSPSGPAILLSNGSGVIAVSQIQTWGPGWILAAKYDADGHLLWGARVLHSGSSGTVDAVLDPSGNPVIGCDVLAGYGDGAVVKLNGANGAVIFQAAYGTPSTIDYIRQVRTDLSGNVFVTTSSAAPGASTSMAQFLKYSPTGTLLWTQTFTNTNADAEAVDSAGNIYLVISNNVSLTTSSIIKFDANGNALWTKSVGSLVSPGGAASLFASNGNLVLAWGDLSLKIQVRQVTPAGTILNVGSTSGRMYPGENLALDAAGNVYVAGISASSSNGAPDLFKFNLSTGFGWSRIEAGSQGTQNIGPKQPGVMVDGLGHAVFLSSVVNVAPTSRDTRISTYDAAGNRLWASDLDPHFTADNVATATTDAAGNTFVADYDTYAKLTKFDPNGVAVWNHTLCTLKPDGGPFAPHMAANGNVVIAVRTSHLIGETGKVLAYNPAGAVVWQYDISSSSSVLQDYQVAGDGSVYLLFMQTTNNVGNVRLVKLSSSGAVLWTVNDTLAIQGELGHLQVDGSGNAFVSYGAPNSNLSLEKINSNGSVLWRSFLVGPYVGNVGPVKLDGPGNVYILVQEITNIQGVGEGVIKVNTNGSIVWNAPVLVMSASNPDTPLAVDQAGNCFVAGWTATKARVQKISAAGVTSWTVDYTMEVDPDIYPKLLPDQAGGVLALMADGSPSNGLDYCILKVATDGSFPWPVSGGIFLNHSIRYDSRKLDDIPAALTADSLGNLFVSGTSFGPSNTQDVNVVKYSPS